MLTQKAKFYKNLCINQIFQTNFKSFSNQRSDSTSILTSLNCFLQFFFLLFAFLSFYRKLVFTFSILFKSYPIRRSGTRCAFKNTQRELKHLRNSESTQALGYLESTQRAPGQLESTWTLGGHSGTWILRAPGTWAVRHLRHLDTQALGYLEHLDTRVLKVLGHSRYFI